MKMKKTIKITLELNPLEISVIREGYRLMFPVADSSWFKKQALNVPLLPKEVLSWLDAVIGKKEDYSEDEHDTALKLLNSIIYHHSGAHSSTLVLKEEKIPALSTWANPVPTDEQIEHYPRCYELSIPVWTPKKTTLNFVPRRALHERLDEIDKDHPGFHEAYGQFFGVQTTGQGGPYAHDVEAVLERLVSGNLTGTQLIWD